MSVLVGVSGARRNACAALCVDATVEAVCQQERITRNRGVGLNRQLPREAVQEVLAMGRRRDADVVSYVLANEDGICASGLPRIELDHHHAHAATAFLTSPFPEATIVVCDTHQAGELSVWTGRDNDLQRRRWAWRGQAFASLYSKCAALLDCAASTQEQGLEALAHIGRDGGEEWLEHLFRYDGDRLTLADGWASAIRDAAVKERERHARAADTAAAVQRRIGALLLEFLKDVRAATTSDVLCLGGGFFYNTYFTTLVRRSGLFRDVFVPISPGNAGLAVGAALAVARTGRNSHAAGEQLSPFLGPEYPAETIKAVLDGCKLSYAYVGDSEATDIAVDALRRGYLVGWFQDRMEWGHKALGNRSILADPTSPFVLENLNTFLRKRESWRAFGVSVCADELPDLFCGAPVTSDFMQFECNVRDDRLRHALPAGATSIRVQTVTREHGRFRTLHDRFRQASGVGAIINTSLNAFSEPIACSPRDAVRVFYGTGLDVLIMGRFVLRK